MPDTVQFTNGNLKYDLDRGISYITYNLLNLPDTVQFSNGNMLIQEYDADGRKTATHKVVMAQPLMVPVGIIINLHQENYSLRTTYYADNADISEPTSGAIEFTFHNAEGYVKYSPYAGSYRMCYYVRDHLGNICAVWDTEDLQYTQRTWYYPSGVPMYISSGQLVQPMKYTGKPYEEMEGFDVFDYGFRGYYATIVRFTSIDPLAEETPWQSPYAYAANGINIMAGTGSVLAATILFGTGVGEIITVGVTAYAVMDIGCGWITGQSLSNHLDKRWESWNF